MADVVHVSSRSNAVLIRMRKLALDPVAYRKLGQIWLEGEHLCSTYAASGGQIAQAVIAEPAWEKGLLRDLASRAESVTVVPLALMATLSALESSPPLAFAVAWPGLGTIRPDACSVVLDRVQDAGNVGTVLRSAAAFGCTQVLALKGTAALWSPKVLRSAMGAHFGLNLLEGLDESALAELQVPLFAASPRATRAIHEVTLPWPCAWVFGNEGQGVSPALQQRCSSVLRIPQPGGEESLNVAAAAAVCLYEAMRQRMVAARP